jgi:hypothetical protein
MKQSGNMETSKINNLTIIDTEDSKVDESLSRDSKE